MASVSAESQRAKEGDEVGFVLRGKADPEPLIVELHHFFERCGCAVVEVRGTTGQAAQNRSLEFADIRPLSADQRAAR